MWWSYLNTWISHGDLVAQYKNLMNTLVRLVDSRTKKPKHHYRFFTCWSYPKAGTYNVVPLSAYRKMGCYHSLETVLFVNGQWIIKVHSFLSYYIANSNHLPDATKHWQWELGNAGSAKNARKYTSCACAVWSTVCAQSHARTHSMRVCVRAWYQ